MIHLSRVSHNLPGSRKPLLVDATVTFHSTARVGVLMPPAGGASVLARLLCGVEKPESGSIVRSTVVSWPLGFAGFFHPGLTGTENVVSICRIGGFNAESAVAFCRLFLGNSNVFSTPLNAVSRTERAGLAFALSLAVPFGTYIVDGVIAGGDDLLRRRFEAFAKKRFETSGLIFFSKNVNQLKNFCDQFYVIDNYNFLRVPSVEMAKRVLDGSVSRTPRVNPMIDNAENRYRGAMM